MAEKNNARPNKAALFIHPGPPVVTILILFVSWILTGLRNRVESWEYFGLLIVYGIGVAVVTTVIDFLVESWRMRRGA